MFRKRKELVDKIAAMPQFKSFMKTLAIAGFACSVVGLLLKMKGVHTGDNLLIVGMSVLAVVAFLLGWIFPNAPEGRMSAIWKFAMTLTGFSLAVVLLGLLFWLMHWYGSITMLILGGGSLAICGIAWLYYFFYIKK